MLEASEEAAGNELPMFECTIVGATALTLACYYRISNILCLFKMFSNLSIPSN